MVIPLLIHITSDESTAGADDEFDGEIRHDPDAAEDATFRVAVPLHGADA